MPHAATGPLAARRKSRKFFPSMDIPTAVAPAAPTIQEEPVVFTHPSGRRSVFQNVPLASRKSVFNSGVDNNVVVAPDGRAKRMSRISGFGMMLPSAPPTGPALMSESSATGGVEMKGFDKAKFMTLLEKSANNKVGPQDAFLQGARGKGSPRRRGDALDDPDRETSSRKSSNPRRGKSLLKRGKPLTEDQRNTYELALNTLSDMEKDFTVSAPLPVQTDTSMLVNVSSKEELMQEYEELGKSEMVDERITQWFKDWRSLRGFDKSKGLTWTTPSIDQATPSTPGAPAAANWQEDQQGGVVHDAYIKMSTEVGMVLIPETKREELAKAVEEDWEEDRHGSEVLTYPLFKRAMLELVNMWCDVISEDHYSYFLDDLRAKVHKSLKKADVLKKLKPFKALATKLGFLKKKLSAQQANSWQATILQLSAKFGVEFAGFENILPKASVPKSKGGTLRKKKGKGKKGKGLLAPLYPGGPALAYTGSASGDGSWDGTWDKPSMPLIGGGVPKLPQISYVPAEDPEPSGFLSDRTFERGRRNATVHTLSKGTFTSNRYYIYIPKLKYPQDAHIKWHVNKATKDDPSQLRILIGVKHPCTARVVQRMLAYLGQKQVTVVHEGLHILQLLQDLEDGAYACDLILVELEMPGISAIDVAKLIQHHWPPRAREGQVPYAGEAAPVVAVASEKDWASHWGDYAKNKRVIAGLVPKPFQVEHMYTVTSSAARLKKERYSGFDVPKTKWSVVAYKEKVKTLLNAWMSGGGNAALAPGRT